MYSLTNQCQFITQVTTEIQKQNFASHHRSPAHVPAHSQPSPTHPQPQEELRFILCNCNSNLHSDMWRVDTVFGQYRYRVSALPI